MRATVLRSGLRKRVRKPLQFELKLETVKQELAKEHNCTSNPSSAHGSQQHELPLRPSLDLRCRGRVRV